MRNSFIKLLLSIVLSVSVTFSPIAVNASPVGALPNTPSAQHKATVKGFIDTLDNLQKQIYSTALSSLEDKSVLVPNNFTNTIQSINNNLQQLNTEIQNYFNTLPNFSEENREVLLLFNVFNFVKDGLYSISLINNAPSDVEKVQLLDRYFRSRLSAYDTLSLLNELLTSY